MGVVILIILAVVATLVVQHYKRKREEGRLNQKYRNGTILDETPRTKEERHHEILSILRNHDDEPVNKGHIAGALDVSHGLVKKDIAELSKKGYIKFVKQVGNKGAVYKVSNRVTARKVTK